jgi:excisionase family DNA binding protein
MSEKLLLTVGETQKKTGLGRDRTYALIRSGRIRSIKVGARLFVPRTELEAWIARELDEGRAAE